MCRSMLHVSRQELQHAFVASRLTAVPASSPCQGPSEQGGLDGEHLAQGYSE